MRIGTGADATQASFATIFGESQMIGMHVFADLTQGGGPETRYVTDGVASL